MINDKIFHFVWNQLPSRMINITLKILFSQILRTLLKTDMAKTYIRLLNKHDKNNRMVADTKWSLEPLMQVVSYDKRIILRPIESEDLNRKYVQLPNFAYTRLLDKPYENEVTLREQNPPLKCCQPFEILNCGLRRGLDLSIQIIWGL